MMKSILPLPKRIVHVLLVTAVCFPLSFATADTALDHHRQALDMIADFADRFCKDIPLDGSGDNLELSGEAKAELRGIVKKLANFGLGGAGKYQNSEYQGLLQEDLVEGLKTSANCRLTIWSDLKSTLLTTTPDTVDKPNYRKRMIYSSDQSTQPTKSQTEHIEYNGKYNRVSCGSIIDKTTSLEWFVGPNETMTWYEAREWTSSLSQCHSSWRMPAAWEIATLYDSAQTAGIGYFAVGKKYPNGRRFPVKIHPIFDGIRDDS